MPRMTCDYPKCFVGNLHRDLTLDSFWEWLHKEGLVKLLVGRTTASGSDVELAHVSCEWDFCYSVPGYLYQKEYVWSGESSGEGRMGAGGGKISNGCVPRESSSAPGKGSGPNTRGNLKVVGA